MIGSSIPKEMLLRQNYPNPFNPSTMIEFGLSEEAQVNITIYNILGKVITTIVEGRLPAGYYRLSWTATTMANGIYFYRMISRPVQNNSSAHTFIQTKKLLLLK